MSQDPYTSEEYISSQEMLPAYHQTTYSSYERPRRTNKKWGSRYRGRFVPFIEYPDPGVYIDMNGYGQLHIKPEDICSDAFVDDFSDENPISHTKKKRKLCSEKNQVLEELNETETYIDYIDGKMDKYEQDFGTILDKKYNELISEGDKDYDPESDDTEGSSEFYSSDESSVILSDSD